MKAAWIALVGIMAIGQANADSGTGSGLLAQCNDVIKFMAHPDDIDRKVTLPMGLCIGMVEGVLKTMRSVNSHLPKAFQTCFPRREITNDEAVRVVVKYLEETELTDTDDATLAMYALQEHFLCKS